MRGGGGEGGGSEKGGENVLKSRRVNLVVNMRDRQLKNNYYHHCTAKFFDGLLSLLFISECLKLYLSKQFKSILSLVFNKLITNKQTNNQTQQSDN